MTVTSLLNELAKCGKVLEPDTLTLPRFRWPDACSKALRQALARHKRAIVSRIVPPVFIHLDTLAIGEISPGTSSIVSGTTIAVFVCVALIDDQVIVWIPDFASEHAAEVSERLNRTSFGTWGDIQVFTGRKPPLILRQAIKVGRAFCSYDGQDDLRIWQSQRLTAPLRWIDLRTLARSGGWPEKREDLIWNVITSAPPDEVGAPAPASRDRNHPRRSESLNVAQWVARIRYDLDLLVAEADVSDRLREHDEPDLLDIHHAINTRGIALDRARAQVVLGLAQEQAQRDFSDITTVTEGTMTAASLLNDADVLAWLARWGQRFPNLHAKTIEWSLHSVHAAGGQHHPIVEAVLKARLSLAHQPIGSLMQALEVVDDAGRVRDHLVYFATRAGEWTSRGIAFDKFVSSMPLQLDMSSFADKELNWDALQSMLPADMPADAALASMVASCFVPAAGNVFCICKWQGLEAHILAWLGGETRDGKIPQSSARATEIRSELARQLHQALAGGQDANMGRYRLSISPRAIAVRLSTGRAIHYRKLTQFQDSYPADVPGWLIPRFPENSSLREKLDANVVVDDIVRGVSRDLVATSLIHCEHTELPVVVHGPDYIVGELPMTSAEATLEWMVTKLSSLPDWASGMSLNVEGYIASRLGSCDSSTGTVLRSRNGEILK